MVRRLLALLVTTFLASPASADEDGAVPSGESGDTSQLVRANRVASRALAWLASRIRSDGSIEMTDSKEQPRYAASSLAALAFMANGHTADENEDGHGARVRALVGWLMDQPSLDDCTCSAVKGPHEIAKFQDAAFTTSSMHSQGYATWALAMAYGMSFGSENVDQRTRLERITQAAVHCIERAQHAGTGGWWYGFVAENNHEGSVTVTVLQALRSAKEAGLRVDAGVIARAVDYLRKSQVRDESTSMYGGFQYRIGDRITSFALTAAAVSSLNQTGDYDSKFVDLGIEYMRQKDPLTHVSLADERWPWYGRFYATQSYWQYRDLRHFRGWYPALIETAAREQNARDGHFADAEFGDVYATAMAALTLGVPFGFLPSFQR